MPEITVSASSLATLGRYLLQWLQSLSKASDDRKRECLHAIEAVQAAVRRTQRYVQERNSGRIDAKTEADLASMWTDLGFRLSDLGVKKLAKRCDVKGRYWADKRKFSEEWWDQADIELDSVAELARRLHAEIQSNGAPSN